MRRQYVFLATACALVFLWVSARDASKQTTSAAFARHAGKQEGSAAFAGEQGGSVVPGTTPNGTHWFQPSVSHHVHPEGRSTVTMALIERVRKNIVDMVEHWPVKTNDVGSSTGAPDSLALVALIMFMQTVTHGDFRILEVGCFVGSTSSAMAYTLQREFRGRSVGLTTVDGDTTRYHVPNDIASIVTKRQGRDYAVLSKMVHETPRPQLNFVFLDANMDPKSLPLVISMLRSDGAVAFHDVNLPSDAEVDVDKGLENIISFNDALLNAQRQCQWFIHSLPASTFPPYDLRFQATLTLSKGKQDVNQCVAMCIPESIMNVKDYPKVYNFHGMPSDLKLRVTFKPVRERLVGHVDRTGILPRLSASELCREASLKLVPMRLERSFPDVRTTRVGLCSFRVSVPRTNAKTTFVVFWLTTFGPVFGGYFRPDDS